MVLFVALVVYVDLDLVVYEHRRLVAGGRK